MISRTLAAVQSPVAALAGVVLTDTPTTAPFCTAAQIDTPQVASTEQESR